LTQIATGASSNSYVIEFPNHTGTHIDTPNHFDPNGPKITEFNISELIFERPLLIDVKKTEGELFLVSDFENHRSKIQESDFLLIRTGFEALRSTNADAYSRVNPGFSAGAAEYLARGFPALRGIGLDTLSLSSVQHREEGRAAHRALLVGRRFVIVEDMRLSDLTKPPMRLFVVPLFLEGVDGTPCTVIAEISSGDQE
jgi:kynurenine formamidase